MKQHIHLIAHPVYSDFRLTPSSNTSKSDKQDEHTLCFGGVAKCSKIEKKIVQSGTTVPGSAGCALTRRVISMSDEISTVKLKPIFRSVTIERTHQARYEFELEDVFGEEEQEIVDAVFVMNYEKNSAYDKFKKVASLEDLRSLNTVRDIEVKVFRSNKITLFFDTYEEAVEELNSIAEQLRQLRIEFHKQKGTTKVTISF